MRCSLPVPYLDSRAAVLAWHLGATSQPVLARLAVPVPRGSVELNLLGGSHLVVAGLDGAECSEVVACSAGPPGLPGAVRHRLDGMRYGFASRVEVLDPEALAVRAQELVRELGDRPDALVGAFPGSPYAITALVAGSGSQERSIRWRTWHLYPNSGEMVRTASVVTCR